MRHFLLLLLSAISIQVSAKNEVQPTSSFTVSGEVNKKIEFKLADLKTLKQDTLEDAGSKLKTGNSMGILLKTLIDSAGIATTKHKEFGQLVIILTASDGYVNTYSWSELYKTDIGNHVYVITKMDGKDAAELSDRIMVFSLHDINSGGRHLKGLSKVEIRKIQ